MHRLRAPVACLAVFIVAGVSFLARAERPRIYAIAGATVVTSPGRTIESGTIVFRDGLIESVGADVVVPPDAVVIDGEGLWVYPGLIDPDSDLGLASPSGERRQGGSPQREGRDPGAVHPIGRIRPETRARDGLRPFEGEGLRAMQRHRDLGFTTVLAVPQRGLLRGRSVAIQLGEERPVAELILRDDVAQHVAFEFGRFGQGYPTSLMGAVAALRQALLDAERHSTWSARHAASPAGMPRPERHAAHEALADVLTRDTPLFFTVAAPADALLADRLGREFDVDVIVSGSGHEWEIASAWRAADRPLVLPVRFPDEPDLDEPGEVLDASIRVLRRFLDAPAGPARLHEAGVQFAFTTRGLKNTADFYGNVRKIVEAGLPEDVALAALTTRPAELLRIDGMAGSLEPGKIANALIADGPLFDEDTKVRRVFVDGVDHEIEVKEKPKGDPNAVVDPRGEWSVVFEIGGNTIQRMWTITGGPGDYSGTAETSRGDMEFDSVELVGNALTLRLSGDRGSTEATVIVEGDEFEGVIDFGARTAQVKGTRPR